MRIRNSIFAMAAVAIIAVAPKIRVQAAPETMPDGTVFDAEFYAQQNPDVVAAFGADPAMLYQHYVVAGKAEGRLPYAPAAGAGSIPADFDPVFYAATYPDVAAIIGTDPMQLYQHYIQYGKAEGRLGKASGTPVVVQQPVAYTGMDYRTKDLNGNAVSLKDIFSTHKYTMVNLWATWCGPCRSELPELAEIAKEFEAKGCVVIGLVDDGDSAARKARNLLSSAGANYQNLVCTNELGRVFYTGYVPSSFFVDQTGHIVGEPIVGADPDGYREMLAQLLR